MKVATVVSALATCFSFLSVGAQAPQVPVDLVTPPPLQSHLGGPATFYRAVTKGEVAHIGNYPLHKSPTDYYAGAGDFSPHGGLYVFASHDEAMKWGDSFSSFPKPTKWYLVKFQYTPDKSKKLKLHSFLTGTPEWKKFVLHNYASTHPAPYDIVEGPISHGSGSGLGPYVDATGHMIYQAGFTSKASLHTLIVESVEPFTPKSAHPPSWCQDCHIM